MAGLDRVPAIVTDMEDRAQVEVSLVENLQREDLNPLEEAAGISCSTHMLPLPLMIDYLSMECGCRPYLIGIQPKNTEQGMGIHPRVREGARRSGRRRSG